MFSMAWLPTLDSAAVDALLAPWRGQPGHVLVLLPDRASASVAMVQQRCRSAGVAVAGAVFPDLVLDGQEGAPSAIFLRFAGGPPPLLLGGVSGTAAVAPVAERLAEYVHTHLTEDMPAALMCLFDALVPNIASHLDAWYLRLANRVSYFGANAGNERFQPAPCLFDGSAFIGDGVLLQLLPEHPGACQNHGYAAPEALIAATSAVGNRIVQIDWRPALEVYAELIKSQYGIEVGRETFYNYAVHFPFGIVRADGEILVRIPVALAEDDSIVCVGEIPANSILTLLDARTGATTTPSVLAADLAATEAPVAGQNLLVFYCAGRRLHKKEGVGPELVEIARLTAAAHVVGALSLGEIGGARSGGYPLFHNGTVMGIPCLGR